MEPASEPETSPRFPTRMRDSPDPDWPPGVPDILSWVHAGDVLPKSQVVPAHRPDASYAPRTPGSLTSPPDGKQPSVHEGTPLRYILQNWSRFKPTEPPRRRLTSFVIQSGPSGTFWMGNSVQFSSVQTLSHVQLSATPWMGNPGP